MVISQEASRLEQAWISIQESPSLDLSIYATVLAKTIDFTYRLCNWLLESGQVIGKIWAAELKHMTEEQATIFQLLPGPGGPGGPYGPVKGMSIRDELNMWLKEAAEKTVYAGHQIDPVNDENNKVAGKALMLGMFLDKASKSKNSYPESAVKLANRETKKLLKAVQSNQVYSHLPQDKILHEIRESQWRDQTRIPALLRHIQARENRKSRIVKEEEEQ